VRPHSICWLNDSTGRSGETRSRGLLLATILAGLITASLIGSARGSRPIVEAERVILKDQAGKIRASFGLAGDGSPVLGLNDKNGMTRVTLGILNERPELTFADKDSRVIWKAP
jgi:hypothetical protein